eukprot:SAG31_NODE_11023_length_1073_cov_1.144764_3_plen_50_part_01
MFEKDHSGMHEPGELVHCDWHSVDVSHHPAGNGRLQLREGQRDGVPRSTS